MRFNVAAMTASCLLVLSVSLGLGFRPQTSAEQGAATKSTPRLELEAKAIAILGSNCACHSGKHPESKMSLEPQNAVRSLKDVQSREVHSLKRIDTSDPGKSYLLMKIRGDKGIKGKRMPRSRPPLSDDQIAVITQWVYSLASDSTAERGVQGDTLQGSRK